MKYIHTVTLVSGNQQKFEFKNKDDSDKAISRGKMLNSTFKSIKCIEIENKNGKEIIDFEEEN